MGAAVAILALIETGILSSVRAAGMANSMLSLSTTDFVNEQALNRLGRPRSGLQPLCDVRRLQLILLRLRDI
jgi:hypothetical protein